MIKAFPHVARNGKTDTEPHTRFVCRLIAKAYFASRKRTGSPTYTSPVPIKCRVHLTNAYTNVDTENTQAKKSVMLLSSLTCSMTSGAIQHGVPTKVCRTFCRLRSRPVASHALTPKSAICTVPSSPSRILPAFMSLILFCR